MKKQVVAAIALSVVSIGLMQASFGQQAPPAKAPPAAATPATEDIIYMRDGRVLHGQILVETSRAITFEYHEKNLNNVTKLNLPTADVAEIMRDQPMSGPAPAAGDEPAADDAAPAAPSSGGKVKEEFKPSYGAARFQSADATVPSLYIVPMGGQFGTDVRAEVYKPVIDDIRKNKPSVVVLRIDSVDSFQPELMFPTLYDVPKTDPALERGMLEFENYRELIHMFRDGMADMKDTKQVVWIHNSDGISAVVAMAWPEMYMTPSARFGGMLTVLQQSGASQHADRDVRAKMMAAWLGFAKSFLDKGGYSQELADAMLQPEKMLSGSWKGRKVEWRLDRDGEYVVDDNDKRTVNFLAKTAEDLCISQGTAAELDDLALLLNFREYRVIEGKQNDLVMGYVKDWRDDFTRCRENLQNYEKYLSWASGEDTIVYLGKALKCLKDVLSALERYKAIEIRLGTDFGLNKITLIQYIEQMEEQLRALKQRGRSGGGGGGGRSGGGGRTGSGGGQEGPG